MNSRNCSRIINSRRLTSVWMPRLCLLGALLALQGCIRNPCQTTKITDVTKAQAVVLHKIPSQGHVHAVSIRVTGEIAGEATLQLFDDRSPKSDGSAYRQQELAGPVNVTWEGDWYSDEARIVYTPRKVSSGTIEIHYEFKD